jgi:hypothetical protein
VINSQVLRVYRPTAHCIHTAKRGQRVQGTSAAHQRMPRVPSGWDRLLGPSRPFCDRLARTPSHYTCNSNASLCRVARETHLFDALLPCHVDSRRSAQMGRQDSCRTAARRQEKAIPASALPTASDGRRQVAGRVQLSGVNSCLAAGRRNANPNAHARRHSIAQTGSVSDLALGDSRSHPISRSFQTRLHVHLVDLTP